MSALKSPQKTAVLMWEGRELPMELTVSGWRVRSRSRHFPINYSSNIQSLRAAQADIRAHLQKLKDEAEQPRGSKTLQDVVEAYKAIPKKAGEAAQKISIYRLKAVVRSVTGKDLDKVLATAIDAKFWLDYIGKQQGRAVADLGDRSPRNASINSAMRTAAAIFKPALRPLYAEFGIVFDPSVTTIQWLPRLKLPRPKAKVEDLDAAWHSLRGKDDGMWEAIGLARWAGLRRNEAMSCMKSWVEVDGAATYIRLCDRPLEGFRTKTGENYRALVVNEEFAAFLRAAPEGLIARPNLVPRRGREMSRKSWFEKYPQAWAKVFTGEAKKPLHRLRGLYLDDVAKLTEDAVKAKLAGERAAAEAAGHTSTKTTKDSYLSD